MKKCILLIPLFLILAQLGQSQTILVDAEIGYGTFMMSGTKRMIQKSIRESNLPLKLVENFPPFFVYGISFSYGFEESTYIGVSLSRGSTGSRAHYQDYSGEISLDHLAKSTTIGVTGEKEMLSVNRLNFSINGALHLVLTNYNIRSSIKVYPFQEDEGVELLSESLALELGTSSKYHISNYCFLKAKLGLLLDTQGKLHLPNDRNMYLVDKNEFPIKSDWTGIRSSIGIGFSF